MHVLSINPDGDYFKVAVLSLQKKMVKINLIKEYKKDIVDLNQLKKEISQKADQLKGEMEVVSALSVDDIFIRNLHIPLKKKRAVLKALPFQMESLLPFSKDHSTTVYFIKKIKEGSLVKLYSYLNESMQVHLQEVKTLGFDPDYVSSVPMALYRFVEMFVGDTTSLTVIHFGWEKSFVVSIEGGEVSYSVSIDCGFKSFVDAIKEDFPDLEEIDFSFIKGEIENESSLENEALTEVLKFVQKGLKRVFEFLARKRGRGDENRITFTGYADIMREVVKNIENFSYKEVTPKPHLEFDKEEISSYAIEIGLALDCLEKDEKTLQLRVGKFISVKLFDRLKKKMKLYVGLSFICCFMAFLTVCAVYLKKQALVKDRFKRVVALGDGDMSLYRNMQKFIISPSDCKKDVNALLQKFKEQKGEGLLLTSPPLITECLQWVVPSITPGIAISRILYEILQYPNLDEPKKPYEIEFKITFAAKDKEEAERFYQSVLENGKQTIKESSIKGTGHDFEALYCLKV